MILCLLGCFAARSQTYTATLPIDNYYDIEGESVFETEAFYTIAELCFSNGYRPVDAAGAKSQLEYYLGLSGATFAHVTVNRYDATEGEARIRLDFDAFAGTGHRTLALTWGNAHTFYYTQVEGDSFSAAFEGAPTMLPDANDSRYLQMTGGVPGFNYSVYRNNTFLERKYCADGTIRFGPYSQPAMYSVRSDYDSTRETIPYPCHPIFVPGALHMSGYDDESPFYVPAEGGIYVAEFLTSSSYPLDFGSLRAVRDSMNVSGIAGYWPVMDGLRMDIDSLAANYARIVVCIPPNGTNAARTLDTRFCVSEMEPTLYFEQAAGPSLQWGRSGIRKRTFTNGDNLTAHSFLDAEYYDGLGFLEQTVAAKGAPTGKSIVRPVVYDLMRRDDARVCLPYAVTAQTGAWESGAVTAQGAWYAGVDARPWSDTDYETGLSGRPTSVMREGAAWATNHKSATMRYDLNDGTSEEDVLNLKYAQGQGGAPDTVRVAGTATALTFFVTTATDEDGSTVQTFTDAEGRTVLERRFSGLGGQGIVSDTYTVYDRYGRVVCVIQPEGAEQLESGNPTSFTFDSAFAQQWCFTYGYDAWGNVIRRHVPGAGMEKTLYDSRGRAVLHADAVLQAAGKWQYTLYDAMDRVTEEGYAGLAYSEATVRAQLENAAGNSAPLLNTCLTGKVVTRTATYWENAGTLTGFVPISGLSLYQNGNYCRTLLAQETLYAVPSIGSNGTLQQASFSRTRKYFYDDKGRVIQLQETDSDGWSARYSTQYDFLGNVVKTKEEHIAPGGRTDDLTVSNTLTDRGVVLSSTVTANGAGHTTTYSYDDLGRITGKQLAFGNTGNAVSEQYDWDIHGWQTSHLAKVKGTQVWGRRYRRTSVSPADSVTAWPGPWGVAVDEAVDTLAVVDTTGVVDIVEEWDNLEDFNWPYSPKASWTGRIAETETAWTSGGSATRRAYRYDGMGRLRSATTRTDIDWPLQPWNGEGFPEYEYLTDEHYTYDRNGNISSLERLNGTEYAAISMTRTGNRLTTADVTEWDGDDEMEYSIYNYNHNANGAMTFDSMIGEEGATLRWNAAGLLHTITDEESGEGATYVWLSDGTKVKMDGDVDSPRYYRGSFVYKDVSISVPTGYDEGDYDTYDFEGLESIAHSEGRFVATDWTTTGVPTLSDRHFVRDLVGSTVTVIDVARAAVASNLPTLNAALVEQDAYLAYGDRLSASAMTLKTDTDNRYRFNGKERHDWAGYAYIDYGARMSTPVTGSWLSPDPLADKYTSTSPYVFCAGDPVNYVDKDGKKWENEIQISILKNSVENKLNDNNIKIRRLLNKLDTKNLSEKRIQVIRDEIDCLFNESNYLQNSLIDIDLIANDSRMFRLKYITGNEHHVTLEQGIINIETSSDAISLHEITHVGQGICFGKLEFNENGLLKNPGNTLEKQAAFEVEAYRVQFSMDGSFPGSVSSLNDINIQSVGDIKREDNTFVYPSIKKYSDWLKLINTLQAKKP